MGARSASRSQPTRICFAPPDPRGIGARGFEPPTACAQGRRATRLRYAPREATAGCTQVSTGVQGSGSLLSRIRAASQRLQHRAQPFEGATAVAQAVLVGRGQLRERSARCLDGQEERVVAEAVRSPGSQSDAAVHAALGAEEPAVRSAKRGGAEEVRASLLGRYRLELAQQPGAPRLVGRRVARAVQPGASAERIDAEAAVVAERPGPGGGGRGVRLELGVLGERLARLLGRGKAQLGERAQFQIDPREQLAQLDELPRVTGRDDEDHPREGRSLAAAFSSAARCSSCSSRVPFWASATMAWSCAGVKGFFSAVPCTSSSSPAALETTLKSTSAAKSSS